MAKVGPAAVFPSKLGAIAQLSKMCGWNEPEKREHGASNELTEPLKRLRGGSAGLAAPLTVEAVRHRPAPRKSSHRAPKYAFAAPAYANHSSSAFESSQVRDTDTVRRPRGDTLEWLQLPLPARRVHRMGRLD